MVSLVDLNQYFRVIVLRALNGLRPVVFEREVALAETWEEENKGLSGSRQCLAQFFSFQL